MDDRTRTLLARGREHFAANEFDKAERALAPLARDKLPFADVYEMLGVMLYQKGRVKQAQTMFEEALRLNPGYTEAALNLAVAYNEQGLYGEAKDVYKRMMAARKAAPATEQLDPFVKGKIANMHAEVGIAYEQTGLFLQAAGEYERALALCPAFVDIRMRLGAAYRAAGNNPAAVREFERAKKEKPTLAGPRLQLGMTYYAAKRLDEASQEWKQVLAMEPENKFAKLYLRLLADGVRGGGRSRAS